MVFQFIIACYFSCALTLRREINFGLHENSLICHRLFSTDHTRTNVRAHRKKLRVVCFWFDLDRIWKNRYGNSILSDLNRGLSTPYKAHCIETSMLLDKRLFKMVNGRFVRNTCHYVSVGLIGAPEFRLQFSKNREVFNRLEASGMLGLSFTHTTKNRGRSSMARSQQLDFFIKQGFTPTATLQIGNQSFDFRRFEVGAQLRFVFHQVNSFLPQRSRRR